MKNIKLEKHQYSELRDLGIIIADDHLKIMHLGDLSAVYPHFGAEDEQMVAHLCQKLGILLDIHAWHPVTIGYRWRLAKEWMKQDGVEFINLTPHNVMLQGSSRKQIVIEPDPTGPARVESCSGREIGSYSYISLHRAAELLSVERLPPPKPGVIYIVSSIVAQHCVGRKDVFHPGTGPRDECIRDEHGQVYAVTRLIQAPEAPQQISSACPKGCEGCGI